MTDEPDSLAAALALLQTKLPEIKKSQTAQVQTQKGANFTYNYADLARVSAAIMPLLGKLGLSFLAKPTFVGERFVLAYALLHISGDREDGEYPLPSTGTPQSIGSAITYGRRYCLCAVTGVAPEDDDDASAAEAEAAGLKSTAQRRRQPAARPAPEPEPSTSKRTAQRTSARTAEPPLPGEDGFAETKRESKTDGPTDRQLTLIHTLFTNIGWTERDDRLNAAAMIVGRKMGSSKELTRAEASRLIDELEPIAKSEDPQIAMLDLVTRYEQEAVEGEIVEEQE